MSEKKTEKNNNKLIIIIVTALIIAITIGVILFFVNAKSNASIAKFDGGKLTPEDFEFYYKLNGQYMIMYYGYTLKDVISEATSQEIVYKLAKDEGIEITAEDEAEIKEVTSSEETIKQLEALGIPTSKMEEYGRKIYTANAYLKKLAEGLTDDKVTAYIKEKNGEDVDMTEYVVQYILLKTVDENGVALDEATKASKKSTIEAILARVNAGEDFTQLAKEFSEDTSTAKDGGILKLYNDSSIEENFYNAATALEVGAHTGVVENRFGYNIIYLKEKNEGGRINSEKERQDLAYDELQKRCESIELKINEEYAQEIVDRIQKEAEEKQKAEEEKQKAEEAAKSSPTASNPQESASSQTPSQE